MEKKFEITFNKIILKNIYKSFIIAEILFVIFYFESYSRYLLASDSDSQKKTV